MVVRMSKFYNYEISALINYHGRYEIRIDNFNTDEIISLDITEKDAKCLAYVLNKLILAGEETNENLCN